MADTPLSSQMESEYKVAKWNRSTVADGSWLQKYTIEKLKDRDIFLANHIVSNTDDLLAKLEAEIEARKEGDNYISATLVSVSGDLVNVSSDFYDFSAKVENSASVINNTINVFSAKVEQSASDLKDAISDEETRAKEVENNLVKEIDKIKGATDVIAVFGTYEEFTAASAGDWQQTVTDNDFIKVLRDDTYQPTGDEDEGTHDDDYYQVYYEWHDNNSEHSDWTGWSAIGNLDPYYSVAETDEIISDLSSTISDNYLSANGNAVQSGHNIVITKPDGDNTPHIKIETSSHVTFTGVSSTDLSATNASGTNLNYSKVSATNLSSTTISATTASGQNAIFTGVSSQNLTATDFNVDNINAKNVSASESFSGKKITIETSASIPGISATNISGDKLNLLTTNASQSQGTSSATLDSNGVYAFDSQAGSTPYYRTWIDIISGSNLQDGNYVYIDRILNTVNLSPNISANNISSQTFTISGAVGSKKESVSSTLNTIQLIEKYPGTYTYTTTITPKSYSAEYSVGGGGGWVVYDYGNVSAYSYSEDTASITWTNLINAGNGNFKSTDVTAQSFNTSSDNAGYGIVNIYTDWSNAGAGDTDATGSAGLNGCVVWSNGNYTAHNYDNAGGNWASWNDIVKTSNSRWVSGNGITAIVSGTVGTATGVLYFV